VLHDLLCPWQGDVPGAKCSLSKCDDCGEQLLDFCPCELKSSETITYKRFEDVARGTLVMHEFVDHTMPIKDFIPLLRSELQKYAHHHFAARWQSENRKRLMDGMSTKDRIVHVDFAANLVQQCYWEVQAQEFAKFQSSILVFMVGRRTTPFGDVTFDTHYYCSNDRKHDFFYLTKALDHLIPILDPGNVERFHFFSDGPSSQFRNRYLMNYISNFEKKFKGAACQWNFFATCHGRGMWDAEGGRLKHKVQELNQQVDKCGEIRIPEAKALVKWANDTEEGQQWRAPDSIIKHRFVHLLPHVRRPVRADIDGIPGLRSIYCVASKNIPGTVDTVMVSCYCRHCLKAKYSKCSADDVLGEWKPHVF
jgi:hypothetical protein